MTSDSELNLIAALFGPLFVGLVFHGLCIKYGWLRGLAQPIDRNLHFRERPLFGANKTYRGIVAVSLGSALGYGLQSLAPALQPEPLRALPLHRVLLFGLAMGGAAMLSELPNSFLKRQLGVAPGAAGGGMLEPMFYLFDQVDVLLGTWLVIACIVAPTPSRVGWSIVFVVVVHQIISLLGVRLGMRASAR